MRAKRVFEHLRRGLGGRWELGLGREFLIKFRPRKIDVVAITLLAPEHEERNDAHAQSRSALRVEIRRAVGDDCDGQPGIRYASCAARCGLTISVMRPTTSCRASMAAARIACLTALRVARPCETMQFPRKPKSGAPPYVS